MPDTTTIYQKLRQKYWLTALITLPALLLSLFPSTQEYLQYSRITIENGEFWRLVSCHWCHWNNNHLLWNCLPLVILSLFCEGTNRKTLLLCLLLSAPLITISLWYIQPEMTSYRGLSGLDSALFTCAAAMVIIKNRSSRGTTTICIALLLIFMAKTLYESISGQTVFASPTELYVPVPLAHLTGGIIGIVSAWLTKHRQQT